MLEENMIRWRNSVIREGRKEGREVGRQEGRKVGRQEGRKVGRQEGRKVGRQEGREEGRKVGREEGRKEGRKEGQVDGMRRVLLKQMKLRFGPLPLPVRRRLREISSLSELESLAGRLLTANSLSDLGLESPKPR